MAGFSYGGNGDGTSWSSERGNGTTPGGGSSGNAGDKSNNNNSVGTQTPVEKQLAAIQKDPAIKTKLDGMLKAARLINPAAIFTIEGISPSGTINMSVNGLTAEQAKSVGFTGLVMGFYVGSSPIACGSIESGHVRSSGTTPVAANNGNISSPEAFTQNKLDSAKLSRDAATAKLNTANSNVAAQQKRLNNAIAAIPLRQAEIPVAQKKYDDLLAYSKSISHYAKAMPMDAAFKHWQEIGYKTGIAQNELNAAKKRLTDAQNEKTAAEKVLTVAKNAVVAAEKEKKNADAAFSDASGLKDAVKFTVDFYKEVSAKYSAKASALAQDLANEVQGKKIRSVDQALASFNKYQAVLNKKYSVTDRNAIAKALESQTKAQYAASLAKYSKALNFIGNSMDVYDVVTELVKAIRTNSWRAFFVKLESLAAGRVAGGIAAFAFAMITGTAIGVLGFALIMALVGAYVNDAFVEKVNKFIGV